ncbi:MAG: hypothetical protein LUD15_13575 [Bacteroides sp.]|nr:hypothetical protein [Bacteroides sp.]
MRKIIYTFFGILSCLSLLPVYSQSGKHYTTDKDFSNSLVNKVYQDKKGFIWIATENGLNRYDGLRFSIYRNTPGDTTSLKNNYVRTLFEDNQGHFWIGCINGLQLYDRATDTFREIDIRREGSHANPHVTSITERKNGDVWIATSEQGLVSLKKGEPLSQLRIESALTDQLGSRYLNYIFEDSSQRLWIATEDKGLFCYIPETEELQSYKAPLQIGSDDVYTLCEDTEENIFAGTLTGGLFRINIRFGKENFEPILYKQNIQLNIRTLILDHQGRLLIGTDGEGLKEYNPVTNRIEDSRTYAAPFDFSKTKIHSLLEDKDQNLWLGVFQKGLIMIPGTTNNLIYSGYKSVRHTTIGSSCVMAIFKDKSGITWVGTDNDGLYAINDRGERLLHFRSEPGNPHSVPATITTIYEDSNNDLWIGSYFNGLAKVDKKTAGASPLPGSAL